MKSSIFILLISVLTNYSVSAQKPINPTDSLFITGKIKNPCTFTLADLDTFPKTAIKAPITYNQKGEARDSMTGMSGIPLKTLLNSIKFSYEKPKLLNEFYFIFTASDGYRVVFSWNEIYTAEAGSNFFIVTEINGKKINELDQRIFFIANADSQRGNRQIKGLKTIEVRQIE